MNDDFMARIGDNHPPGPPLDQIDPTKLVDRTVIPDVLRLNYQPLLDRRDEFLAGIGRWIVAHRRLGDGAPVIADEEDCSDTLDFLKAQLRKFVGDTGEVEIARRAVKDPLTDAGKAVDAFFNDGIKAPIEREMQAIEQAYTAFLTAKLMRETRAREVAVEQARLEAERLTAQAARASDQTTRDELVDRAMAAEDTAEQLSRPVTTADLTRIRSDLGSVGGLRSNWTWEVTNLMELVQAVARGDQPLALLTTNDKVLNVLVRQKNGLRDVPGLTIKPIHKGR